MICRRPTWLSAITAAWNVRHAREIDGTGAELDLCYLNRLGPEAVVSLTELEAAAINPALKARVRAVRQSIRVRMHERQLSWRGWNWRDARRLDLLQARVGGPPDFEDAERDCNGYLIPQPLPTTPPPTVAPLTPTAGG